VEVSQTSYSTTAPYAFAGMLADTRDHEFVTRRNAESSLAIGFGLGVVQVAGTDIDQGCLLPRQASFSGQDWIGVVVHEHNESGDIALDDCASVCVRGTVVVPVEETVAYGDPVRMRVLASGGNTALGKFRTTADADVDSTAVLTGCKFLGMRGSGLAVLQISDHVTMALDA
jgi:hypothetical protein